MVMNVKQNERRARAKARLEQQLKSNKKPVKADGKQQLVDLEEADIKRIKREIEILSSRV